MKKDLKYKLSLSRGIKLNGLGEISGWLSNKAGEIILLCSSADKIVSEVLPMAIGAPGEAGSLEEIVYAARRLAEVYRRTLEWTLEFSHATHEDEYSRIIELASRMSQNIISEIEQFSSECQQKIPEVISRSQQTEEPQSLTITLSLTCPDMSDLNEELSCLRHSF